MLSMPASTAAFVAAVEPECAATFTPKRCDASMTARISSGVIRDSVIPPSPSVATPPEIAILIQSWPSRIFMRAVFTIS
jgi:hypothetical protein